MGEVVTLPLIRKLGHPVERQPDDPGVASNTGVREALAAIFPVIDAATLDWLLGELWQRGFKVVPLTADDV